MTNTYQEQLSSFRTSIDEIDAQILALLNQRATCAQKVGALKSAHGEGGISYRPEREAQVLRNLIQLNSGPLSDERIGFFFREVMSACLALEQPLRVAFLGPPGTFSEAAALRQFGHSVTLLPRLSFDEIFREVDVGGADFAVVPIENSTEGAIGRTLDLLTETPLKICGEVNLRVEQNLLSNESSLHSIDRVYSHAQSLAQCRMWLLAHLPKAECFPVASNADAAQKAAAEPRSAAIAGAGAALNYSLPILFPNIEDEPNNTTRFIVLGHRSAAVSGQDKTSLVMSIRNETGALFSLLTPFSEAGISMTRLESRPAKHSLWEYLFFVDVEGHAEDKAVANALQALEKRAAWLKVLGSYPISSL